MIPSQPSVFLVLCCQRVLCALEVVKINILGVCFAKGIVFLEGFKVTTLVVCVL